MAKGGQANSTDARFRFSLSEDGMKLGVSRYFPPSGGAGPSVELLVRQVADAGVALPVDLEAAQQVVDSIRETGQPKRVALVSGTPVVEPCNASLVALGDLKFPVFPGDHFARKNGPFHAQAGVTIDGRTVNPKENFEPEDMIISMGENVELDPVTGDYVSQVWGMARYKDGVVSVSVIPHISEDEISVIGTVHHRDFKGRAITTQQIEKEMRDLGVVIDIDADELSHTLDRAKAAGNPLFDQVIVQGAHPVPGRDGWFEFLVSSREEAGTEDDSGRLDFRNRGAYPMVRPGNVIGRLHAPTAGEGGIDLYGKTIPAYGGRELFIHLGEGVETDEAKVTYTAKAEGVVSMEKNTLSVTDCLVIAGDVDLSSGNVHVEKGSVKVMGSIQAGAEVSAPKLVIVGGSVESATVTAGLGVEVAGGILMPGGGLVKCDGDVMAGYTANARIEAGGDVYVANEVTNSHIHTDGHFFGVEGKGIVLGGEIIAAKGMEINEIGSELGVETKVIVRMDDGSDNELLEERAKIKLSIDRIDEIIGNDPPEKILARTPAEKRDTILAVFKHRKSLVEKRKDVSEKLNRLMLARQEKLTGVKVKVKRFIYPGAVISFGGKTFRVSGRREASNIYWSESARNIVFE